MDGCIGCKSVLHDEGEVRFETDKPRRVIRQLQFSNFKLTEHLFAPNTVLPPHTHDACSICVTLDGGCVESHANVRDETAPGTVLIRPAGDLHTNRYGPKGARSFMFELGARLASDISVARVFNRPAVIKNGVISTLALRIYQESRIADT